MLLKHKMIRALLLVFLIGGLSGSTAQTQDGTIRTKENIPGTSSAVLWRDPDDISTRNLFFGPGGKQDAPPESTFTFLKEDLNGTNPKFDVRDADGVKWKVKLGDEARPETVAARLVWAVGYSADEDYFVREAVIAEMPVHLHRGQDQVHPGGVVYNVRLKRDRKGEKKVGDWRWGRNPFSGTRELNGLRVMMALVNNWDLKDSNNAVLEPKGDDSSDDEPEVYFVSDLGASFGPTGFSWPHSKSRGNLKAYSDSKFIKKVTPEYVDFNMPTRPALIRFFDLPDFIRRLHLRWIGRRVPRADARWMGGLLAQLSPTQIRDAFRAAGYSDEEVEGYARIVEARIAALNRL
jgi:hypothetical protein